MIVVIMVWLLVEEIKMREDGFPYYAVYWLQHQPVVWFKWESLYL